MTITSRLSRRLYETLGDDAGHDLVDWMLQLDTQRTELRELNDLNFARFGALISEFRGEVRAEIARLETRIERTRADVIKWSFIFWVGAVGSIALLAGVLK